MASKSDYISNEEGLAAGSRAQLCLSGFPRMDCTNNRQPRCISTCTESYQYRDSDFSTGNDWISECIGSISICFLV